MTFLMKVRRRLRKAALWTRRFSDWMARFFAEAMLAKA
jgi:hypothetical protein